MRFFCLCFVAILYCAVLVSAQISLKICYGSFCGSSDAVSVDIANLGSTALQHLDVGWRKFQEYFKTKPPSEGPKGSVATTPSSDPAVSPQSGTDEVFHPFDAEFHFTDLPKFIENGSEIVFSPEVSEALKNSTSFRDFDANYFNGITIVVSGLFKKGKSWFCQRLSGLTTSFLSSYGFATHGWSAKRVKIANSLATLVDVQGYGFPVDVLNSINVINQQILEEIMKKVTFNIGDAFIQVINEFSRDDQLLMMLTAAKALARDGLLKVKERAETLFLLVHNMRDKTINDFVAHFKHNIDGKLPDRQCVRMNAVPDLDAQLAKLAHLPGFSEGICDGFKPGEFFITSAINGKTTYHFFLVNEVNSPLAVIMNDIALAQMRIFLALNLLERGTQKRGLLLPIIEGIASAIPDYLVKKNGSNATISADPTGQTTYKTTSPAASSYAKLEAGKFVVSLEDEMVVRPELYEIIPTAKLPLPTPVVPMRIDHIYGTAVTNQKSKTPQTLVRAIVVELQMPGLSITNTEFERKEEEGNVLTITVQNDPFYLNHPTSKEIVSEFVFGSAIKKVHIGNFGLPGYEEMQRSICQPENGYTTIIIQNNMYRFIDDPQSPPINCSNYKTFLSDNRPNGKPSHESRFYRLLEYLFG